jgi:hypothetical protein
LSPVSAVVPAVDFSVVVQEVKRHAPITTAMQEVRRDFIGGGAEGARMRRSINPSKHKAARRAAKG